MVRSEASDFGTPSVGGWPEASTSAERTARRLLSLSTSDTWSPALSDVQQIVAPSSVLEDLESIYSHPALRSVFERPLTNQDDLLAGFRAIVGEDAP